MSAPPSVCPARLRIVQEVTERYLAHLRHRCAMGDYSAHALEDIDRELSRFAARYGQQPIEACRQHDLTAWLDSHPEWKSNHTKKRILGCIIRPFLWAEDEELIEASPYRKSRKWKLRTRPRRPAEEREYVLLMRKGSRALRRALFFLRRTGARTCEMRALTWPEVHLDEGYIEFQGQKSDRLADDVLPRIIGLDPCLVRFLRNLHRQRPPDQVHVFLNSEGTPWKDRHVFARHLRRYADRIGLPKDLSGYCFRHFYATNAIDNGTGEKDVADQLGHADTRMISWYARRARKIKRMQRVAVSAVRRERG